MVSSMDRRRFCRIIILWPVRYQIQSPEDGAWHQGQGVIKNISLSGCFFHPDQSVAFQPGQFLYLSFTKALPFLDSDLDPPFTVTGKVVRLESPGIADPNNGVAVSFKENLSFALPYLFNRSRAAPSVKDVLKHKDKLIFEKYDDNFEALEWNYFE